MIDGFQTVSKVKREDMDATCPLYGQRCNEDEEKLGEDEEKLSSRR
jgi:hypothetical protein